MGIAIKQGVITAPTTDGNDTVISGLDTPKAIILWSTNQTAVGDAQTDAQLCIGFFTFDGAAIQQVYQGFMEQTGLATTDTARFKGTTACLKLLSAVTPTVDAEARGVSMDSTSITIDWFNAPTSAVKVNYLVIGGADVTAARCGDFATGTTSPLAVTVNTGFGQPNTVLFLGGGSNINADANGTAYQGLGAAVSDSVRAASVMSSTDAAATVQTADWQKPRAMLGMSVTSAEYECDLDVLANWPTDGFQLVFPDVGAAGDRCAYLALKGSFQATVGTGTAPTAAPTVEQDNTVSFRPQGALVWGGNLASTGSISTADADQTGWMIGATDGTSQSWSGITSDDAATDSVAYSQHNETKGLRFFKPNGALATPPDIQSEATLSLTSTALHSSWADTDSVAREYCYLILGDAVSGNQPTPFLATYFQGA